MNNTAVIAAWSHLLACTDIPIKSVEANAYGIRVDARRIVADGRERRAGFMMAWDVIEASPPGRIAERMTSLLTYLRESDHPTDGEPGTHHYEIRPVRKRAPGSIATAALLNCSLCGKNIDGMGGPGSGQLCLPCGDEIISSRGIGATSGEENDD